jgi:hypothetical protein
MINLANLMRLGVPVFPWWGPELPSPGSAQVPATTDVNQLAPWAPVPGTHWAAVISVGRLVVQVEPHGVAAWHELGQRAGQPAPFTIAAQTASGWDLWFRLPASAPPVGGCRDLLPGIHVKTGGEFVVVPPSSCPLTGRLYAWGPGADPGRCGLAEAPSFLIGLLAARPRPSFLCTQGQGHEAVAFATRQLAADHRVFKRGSALVTVVGWDPPHSSASPIRRPAAMPVIEPLAQPRLWTMLSQSVEWRKHDGRKKRSVNCDPPDQMLRSVLGAGQWPGVRPLDGIATTPILRPDGSLWSAPGYDPSTASYYAPEKPTPAVPEQATHSDAVTAQCALLEVVADFPFATREGPFAWLAALLSPLAAPVCGRAPLFVFDANTPGTGKTLLCEIVGLIVTGRPMACSPYVDSDDEMRKRILAHALAGDSLVLVDNVPNGGVIGWPSLDRTLTADVINDRVLGQSKNISLPNTTTWFCTGNNLAVQKDMGRRCVWIRLETQVERPESRQGFRHHPLKPWVLGNRPRLLAAALTMLSAYLRAGRPSQQLLPLGSFDEWSEVVRGAIVWAGGLDPGELVASGQADAEPEANLHVRLLCAWLQYGPAEGFTVGDALSDALHTSDFLSILAELCNTRPDQSPTASKLGSALRSLKGRPRRMPDGTLCALEDVGRTRTGAVRWAVRRLG